MSYDVSVYLVPCTLHRFDSVNSHREHFVPDLTRKREKDLNLLYQYAGQFGIQKIVRETLEVLL